MITTVHHVKGGETNLSISLIKYATKCAQMSINPFNVLTEFSG